MSESRSAKQLALDGRFADAFKVLNESGPGSDKRASDVLRLELLERLGRYGQCRALAESLFRTKGLDARDRGNCEFVIGLVELNNGNASEAVSRFHRAISLMTEAADLERKCWFQLRLLVTVADFSGPERAASILAELRAAATKLGLRHITAGLHIMVGEMEAKRGLLKSADWHTELGLQLLSDAPNLWLETVAENTRVALAIMRSDVEAGFSHARRSLQLAEQSGSVSMIRAALGNYGNLLLAAGEFEQATDHFQKAIAAMPSPGDNYYCGVDGMARARLFQGRLSECAELTAQIETSEQRPDERAQYARRYSQLTRTQLLARQGRLTEALSSCRFLLEVSGQAGDHGLSQIALLIKAELLQQIGRIDESTATLGSVASTLAHQPPDVVGHYEQILACTLAAIGQKEAAVPHLQRARRLYESIRSTPGLLELSRRWKEITDTTLDGATAGTTSDSLVSNTVVLARDVLQTAAGLLRQHNHAEFLAGELAHLLVATNAVLEARVLSVGPGEPQLLGVVKGPSTAGSDVVERCIAIGSARERAVELHLTAHRDVDAQATVNAITVLLATIQDLERARAEREERVSLWPPDDGAEEAESAVVGGSLQALMVRAKRIGRTTASVLITGESGTGKEIIARAIHRYSERAAKPFIPFNCTAVPRDMLESHLFGHRRGSFTGADRDHPGVIGAARDGTLFLDEIGELSLDLQPKLLRFLESREICPIGESTPFTIDVRIVAATNADVEEQMKAGLFRADLFWRLNVIRLPIPPLRERRDEIPALVRHFVTQASAEFHKSGVRVSEGTMEHLLLCRWPGNIRQLQNEIRRMVALAEPNALLTPADLSDEVFNSRLAPRAIASELEMVVGLKNKIQPVVSRIEREMIRLALEEHPNDFDAAARALGLSRKGLYLKRQRHGL
jgi:DNA-binding NtrC family response regulator